ALLVVGARLFPALALLGRDRAAHELGERRHGWPVVRHLAEKWPDADAFLFRAIPQNGIDQRVRMRPAGVGAVVAHDAEVAAGDQRAELVAALIGPAPAAA